MSDPVDQRVTDAEVKKGQSGGQTGKRRPDTEALRPKLRRSPAHGQQDQSDAGQP